MSHWYQDPIDACRTCGRPADDPAHRRACTRIWSLQGVGWAWCRLASGHEGPCHLRNWDGTGHFGYADGHTEPTDAP